MDDLHALEQVSASGGPALDSLNGIVTPYVVAEWERLLAAHPDRDFVAYIVHGIRSGFQIGADQSLPFRSASSNMQSARENAQVIDDYLRAECSLSRVVGPLAADTLMIHVNRFGVIPKSNQPGKWRLIVDLSHPSGFSVNDGIPRALCSLRYVTVDSAVHIIQQCGQGALLAKLDLESAYRNVPVHPRHEVEGGSLYQRYFTVWAKISPQDLQCGRRCLAVDNGFTGGVQGDPLLGRLLAIREAGVGGVC